MDLYYCEACQAISEYINGCGWPMYRNIPIYEHAWWDILYNAMYNILDTYFTQKKIVIRLTSSEMEYFRARAHSRQSDIYSLSPKDVVFYDILEMVEYYQHDWGDENPPIGYIIPESFNL